MKPTGPTTQVEKPRDSSGDKSAKTRDKGQQKFSKVLDRKSQTGPDGPPAGAMLPPFAAGMQPGLQAGNVQESSAVSGPSRQIDQLAGEISGSLQVSNLGEVRMQFDSQAFPGGLQVTLARQNGKLAVELNARSSEISKLLTQNAEVLAQRLESRGYTGASVQIRTMAAASPSSQTRPDQEKPDQERGGGDGRQQRERKR